MACTVVDLPGLGRAVICGLGRRVAARCRVCGGVATRLCDHQAGPSSPTCDAPLCDRHAGRDGQRDFCPRHLPGVVPLELPAVTRGVTRRRTPASCLVPPQLPNPLQLQLFRR